jgi:hypothetical protein
MGVDIPQPFHSVLDGPIHSVLDGPIHAVLDAPIHTVLDGPIDINVDKIPDIHAFLEKLPAIHLNIDNIPKIQLGVDPVELRLTEFPSIRGHLPADFCVGLSVLGMELMSIRLCGEAQIITEPYHPNPCEVCGPVAVVGGNTGLTNTVGSLPNAQG